MKIRNGFVSNSSSSSFLLVFDTKPKCALDVLAHIWPDLGHIGNPYDTFQCFPVTDAAEAVWNQIKDQKPCTKAKIIENFESDSSAYGGWNDNRSWEAREADAKEKAPTLAKEFIDSAKGKIVYSVSFGDEDGAFGSTMEHGDVFRRITHKSFSHH